jgi:hypothetical protein
VEKADPSLYDDDKECGPHVDLYAGSGKESSWKGFGGGTRAAGEDAESHYLENYN